MASAQERQALEWQDCLAEAQKNNPDLISAQEAIRQQEEAKSVVASGLYPQVNAAMDAFTSKTEGSKQSDAYGMGISGSQLFFDASKTGKQVKAAAESVRASWQSYRFRSSDIRFALRSAFVDLLKAQELIRVTEEILAMRRENLELITLRYQSGLEHRGALLTAEATAASAKFQLEQAKRSIETVQWQLCKAMGRQAFSSLEVAGDFRVRESSSQKPDLEIFAKTHPLILEALARRNQASFTVSSAQADFFPKLTGSASLDKSGTHFMPRDDSWDAGLALSMPLFEGGLRTAQVAQARAAYRQAVADVKSIEAGVLVDLQAAWQSLQDKVGQIDVNKMLLEATRERSNIAEAQYAVGFITFDSWIIIQNDLVAAKRAYLEAQADALLAEAAWIRAKGETIEYAQK